MINATVLRLLFAIGGAAHCVFGIAGLAFPRWFFATVPPWPPLHVGQIQIAGVFDLSMAAGFLIAVTDVPGYSALMIVVGVVAEWGHAIVRIGHILAGDNPAADLVAPLLMLVFGAVLLLAGAERWAKSQTMGSERDPRRGTTRGSGEAPSVDANLR